MKALDFLNSLSPEEKDNSNWDRAIYFADCLRKEDISDSEYVSMTVCIENSIVIFLTQIFLDSHPAEVHEAINILENALHQGLD